MSLESDHTPIRQAARMYEMGQVFLTNDPKTGETGNIIFARTFSDRDWELPIVRNPKTATAVELNRRHEEWNRKAKAMPTSVRTTTVYSVCGAQQGEISIVSSRQIIDPGYKTRKIGLDAEGKIDEAAVAQAFEARRNYLNTRTDDQAQEDEFNKSMKETMLANYEERVILEPSAIRSGEIRIVEKDHMTGLAIETPVKLDPQEPSYEQVRTSLMTLEFNMISKLLSLSTGASADTRERIEDIYQDYLAQ